MSVFSPAWMSKNERRACKAVAALTDQDEILRAATSAHTYAAREAAVCRLENLDAVEKAMRAHKGFWSAARDRRNVLRGCEVLRRTVGLNDQEALAQVVATGLTAAMAKAADELFNATEMGMGVFEEAVVKAALELVSDEGVAVRVAVRTAEATLEPQRLPAIGTASGPHVLVDKINDAENLRMVVARARSPKAKRRALLKLPADEVRAMRDNGQIDDELWAGFEEELLMVGGYVCGGCGAIRRPSSDASEPCRCAVCGAQNHRYRCCTSDRHEVLGTGLTLLPGDVYYQCTRCGDVAWTGMREGD